MKRGVDYIGVGIGAVIVNLQGKLFLAKRGSNAQNERGKWGFPGGALEFGEDLQTSIIREMKEEFDIIVEPLEQLPAVNHLIPQDKQHWIAVAYICKLVAGTPRIMEKDKTEAIGWFALDKVKKLDLTLVTKERIRQIQNLYPTDITQLCAT